MGQLWGHLAQLLLRRGGDQGLDRLTAWIMACIVMAYIAMGFLVAAYIVTAYLVTAYIGMSSI